VGRYATPPPARPTATPGVAPLHFLAALVSDVGDLTGDGQGHCGRHRPGTREGRDRSERDGQDGRCISRRLSPHEKSPGLQDCGDTLSRAE
jgi:hypothetical protein